MINKQCEECSNVFGTNSMARKTCSPKCRWARNARLRAASVRARAQDAEYRERRNEKQRQVRLVKPKPIWRSKTPVRGCVVCGRVFRPSKHHYTICSPECRQKRHDTRAPKPCVACGKAFKPISNRKTCSPGCKTENDRKRNAAYFKAWKARKGL